jgi:hypothetical protein
VPAGITGPTGPLCRGYGTPPRRRCRTPGGYRPRPVRRLMAPGLVRVARRPAALRYRALRYGRPVPVRGHHLGRQRCGRRGRYGRALTRTVGASHPPQRRETATEPVAHRARTRLTRARVTHRRLVTPGLVTPGLIAAGLVTPGLIAAACLAAGRTDVLRGRRVVQVGQRRVGPGPPAEQAAPGSGRCGRLVAAVRTGAEVATGLPRLTQVGDPAQLLVGVLVPVALAAPTPLAAALVAH